ncbi:MAG: glutamine synthetase, partial [Rhodobiaceae bacterium]|nr:glutamine synthetase [Rhodobiaceae bacterium]
MEIECIVPDQSGVARGKLMPVAKFFSSNGMNMPQSIFYQTISGDYPELGEVSTIDPADGDYVFKPDFSTLSMVPWESDPTAQVIHDAFHRDGRPVDIAPRQVLRRIVKLYENRGWKAIVAPEIEFYLVKPNT